MKRIKIFIAGHKGLVGSSLHDYLKKNNFKNIITATRLKLDLTDASKGRTWRRLLCSREVFCKELYREISGMLQLRFEGGDCFLTER